MIDSLIKGKSYNKMLSKDIFLNNIGNIFIILSLIQSKHNQSILESLSILTEINKFGFLFISEKIAGQQGLCWFGLSISHKQSIFCH